MYVVKSLRGGRSVSRWRLIRKMSSVRWVEDGVLFDGGSVRAEREDAVLSWRRTVMARKGLIILGGLGCEGHTVLAVAVTDIFRNM